MLVLSPLPQQVPYIILSNFLLTQISALVVIGFPPYRLIISGALYDSVVYLAIQNREAIAKNLASELRGCFPKTPHTQQLHKFQTCS